MRHAINDTKTSYFHVVHGKCSTGIESDVRFTQYERVVFESVIKQRILNNEDVRAFRKNCICNKEKKKLSIVSRRCDFLNEESQHSLREQNP